MHYNVSIFNPTEQLHTQKMAKMVKFMCILLQPRKKKGKREAEDDVTVKNGQRNTMLWAWKTEEKPGTKECRQPANPGKARKWILL